MSDNTGKTKIILWHPFSASVCLLTIVVLFLLSRTLAMADSPTFIEKVRVGLHKHTVRIVLILDRPPGTPHLSDGISQKPSVTLKGVMPGTSVHRSLTVRTPSFRKYLTAILLSYDPGDRSTKLSVQFVRPVPPPAVMVLVHPHRLVMDFAIEPHQSASSAVSPVGTARRTQKRIVIPGKPLPPAPTPSRDFKSSHPAPSGGAPSVDRSRPHVISANFSAPLRPFRVILDAGHGGKDCGTMSLSGVCEKILVLDIVNRLKTVLQHDPRFSVILTRTDDRFISLPERTRIANENHGDLFLSVHANADPDSSVRGIETFLLNLHSTDPRAQKIAQRENSALGISEGDLSAILLTLKINHKKKRSWELAQEIEDNLASTLRADFPIRNLGVRQAPFYVIMGTTMPAVLTEVNFLSNRTDARLMDSSRFREETALALYRGIVAYFRNIHPESRYPRVTARLVHQEITAREP